MKNTKRCTKCGRELPLECFSKNKNTKDGLRYQCKQCQKQYKAKWDKENTAHNKQYRAEHAEEKKQYYQANREEILEKNKQYRAEHVDEIKQKNKQYMAERYATIEGYAYFIRYSNLQSDREHGRCGKDEDPLPPLEYYIEKFSEGIDYYDGKKHPFNELGFDRIDNSKPHTIDNMVVATTFHNVDRWNKRMSVEEYKAYIQNEELTLACS